jgi:thiol-disulfide isomerase/thioredoxin
MSKLERLTYILLCLTCIASLFVILEPRFKQGKVSEDALAGEKLRLPGVEWTGSHANVVLFASTSCPYCKASVPFYRHLAGLRSVPGREFKLTVVSPDEAGRMRSFLETENIGFDQVVQSFEGAAGLTSTPTLLLVTPDGTVQKTFVGKLSVTLEQRVLGMIGSAGRRS